MKPNNKALTKIIFYYPDVLNTYLHMIVKDVPREEMVRIYHLLCSIVDECELNSRQDQCIHDALDCLCGYCNKMFIIGTGDYHL